MRTCGFSLHAIRKFVNAIRTSRNIMINSAPAVAIERDTIFALSSGNGKCGVAVIRVSGPKSLQALNLVARFKEPPQPRYTYLRKLLHPTTSDVIDKGLVIWFPGPKSFSGEDSCEFQVHGGPAVVAAMLNALHSIPNCRMAAPGEFTKRAFFAGKMDLTEVEGLADLIHAETENQRKQALLQANGSLSKLYRNWRQRLLRSIAHLEAYIDFAEDENIEDNILDVVNVELQMIENEIQAHLLDGRKGEMLKNGVRTAILGAPNVGKSSFLNLLVQRPISIVTNVAGTTRDVIETAVNINGYPVLIADTAGLRTHTKDNIETEGISRAIQYADLADFIILLVDVSKIPIEHGKLIWFKFIRNYLLELGLNANYLDKRRYVVIGNKVDLVDNNVKEILNREGVPLLSCKNSDGLLSVLEEITNHFKELCGEPSAENPYLSQERHRHNLVQCLKYIRIYKEKCNSDFDQDLAIIAHELRNAMRSLGKITGDVSTDDILDVVFRDFCIGK